MELPESEFIERWIKDRAEETYSNLLDQRQQICFLKACYGDIHALLSMCFRLAKRVEALEDNLSPDPEKG